MLLALGLVAAFVGGCSLGREADPPRRRAPADGSGAPGAVRPEPGTDVAMAWSEPLANWPGTLTVHDGQVIVADGQGVVSIFAVDDGSRGWEVRLDASTGEVLPAIDDHTVLLSAVDQFIALDRSTGVTRWSVPTDPDPTTFDGLTLAGAVALVGDPGRADAPVIAVTTVDTGAVRGRRIDDGSEVWSVAGDGRLDGPIAVHRPSGTVMVISRQPGVVLVRALDGLTGRVLWSRQIAPNTAAPVMAGDSVIVAAGYDEGLGRPGTVRALAVVDGHQRWSTEVLGGFESYQVPAVDSDGDEGGDLALVDRMGNAALIDLATGQVRWQHETDGVVIRGRVALTDGFVAYTNSKREVMVRRRSTGRRWGKIAIEELPRSVPTSIDHAGDRLFVGWRWVEGAPLHAIDLAPPN